MKFHNILLRIVFELIICLVESKPHITQNFNNTFTVDILLKIFEDYNDQDLKNSAMETLSLLFKKNDHHSTEIILLFRKLGGP